MKSTVTHANKRLLFFGLWETLHEQLWQKMSNDRENTSQHQLSRYRRITAFVLFSMLPPQTLNRRAMDTYHLCSSPDRMSSLCRGGYTFRPGVEEITTAFNAIFIGRTRTRVAVRPV